MKGQNPSSWLDVSMVFLAFLYMSIVITVVTLLANVLMWDGSHVFSNIYHHLTLAKRDYLMLPQILEGNVDSGDLGLTLSTDVK